MERWAGEGGRGRRRRAQAGGKGDEVGAAEERLGGSRGEGERARG